MTKRKIKFEIGTKVLVAADACAPAPTGTVVRYDSDGDAVVSFRSGGWDDNYSNSYECSNKKHCWFVEPKYLAAAPVKLEAAPRSEAPTKKKLTQKYLGNGEHTWESVCSNTMRLRVPGGWLYGNSYYRGMTFVPMPEVVKHKV